MSEIENPLAQDEDFFIPHKHKGGDVRFRPGQGFTPDPNKYHPVGGDYIFELPDGSELLRIKPDGSFLVRGDKVADEAKLYTAFHEWMKRAKVEHEEGVCVAEGP